MHYQLSAFERALIQEDSLIMSLFLFSVIIIIIIINLCRRYPPQFTEVLHRKDLKNLLVMIVSRVVL